MGKLTIKRKWLIAFIVFVGLFVLYIICSLYQRNQSQYQTFSCELSNNSPIQVDRWHNIGIRLIDKQDYCFFPENMVNSRILEFCGGSSLLPEKKKGSAIVQKEAKSNIIKFIVGNDTLIVRMKNFNH